MLVFGVGAAWLLISALRQGETLWQLHAVLYGVFFALAAIVVWHTAPGDAGGFALGAGSGILYWGFMKARKDEKLAVEPPKPVESPNPVETPKVVE